MEKMPFYQRNPVSSGGGWRSQDETNDSVTTAMSTLTVSFTLFDCPLHCELRQKLFVRFEAVDVMWLNDADGL